MTIHTIVGHELDWLRRRFTFVPLNILGASNIQRYILNDFQTTEPELESIRGAHLNTCFFSFRCRVAFVYLVTCVYSIPTYRTSRYINLSLSLYIHIYIYIYIYIERERERDSFSVFVRG